MQQRCFVVDVFSELVKDNLNFESLWFDSKEAEGVVKHLHFASADVVGQRASFSVYVVKFNDSPQSLELLSI